MLFFRSEELLNDWCRARGATPKPIVTMTQLWGLATAWYATRLEPISRRPGPAEMREIFSRLGLGASFWDPQADTFAN
jgi:hypothetical protein